VQVYWGVLRRLHSPESLPHQEREVTQDFQGTCHKGVLLHRLVLWFQASPENQPKGGDIGIYACLGQHRCQESAGKQAISRESVRKALKRQWIPKPGLTRELVRGWSSPSYKDPLEYEEQPYANARQDTPEKEDLDWNGERSVEKHLPDRIYSAQFLRELLDKLDRRVDSIFFSEEETSSNNRIH